MTKEKESGSSRGTTCDCGHILYFANEGRAFFEKLLSCLPEEGRCVFLLEPSFINSPTYGKVHVLPAPEVLDDERQPIFGLLNRWKDDELSDDEDSH